MLVILGLVGIGLFIKMPLKIHNKFMRDLAKAKATGKLC
jgi:hypothetical protein